MKRIAMSLVTFCLFFTAGKLNGYAQNQPALLWQIGTADNSSNELALAPEHYAKFTKDAFYRVGRSVAAKDWPYAQPGPDDGWAGNTTHTSSILFALRDKPLPGNYQLQVKTIDAGHSQVQLRISVNGKIFTQTLASGKARGIHGNRQPGSPASFDINITADDLKAGNNIITITTEKGSWFVYDWLGFSAPAGTRLQAVQPGITAESWQALPFLQEKNGQSFQPCLLSIANNSDTGNIKIGLAGKPGTSYPLTAGLNNITLALPAVTQDSTVTIAVAQKGKQLFTKDIRLSPVRKMTVYILPHSHNDIGYTEIQTNVERKQMNNLLTGIAYAKQTRDYPAGARFVWNLEGVYAADLFMNRMNAQQKADLVAAVKDGGVALNGMYLNTLTGLCRPEELLQLFRYSNKLAAQCGTTIQSAMISDVPGYTWGTVTAMAQAGIRYFSAAPNYFDRIGDILVQWEDKPFWWFGPSGKDKVLVWIPYRGYAMSHGLPNGLTTSFVGSYMKELEQKKFPYDITYIRWSGHGDNAVPDPSISEFVKDWSSKYTWPKFIISSTTTAFRAFEDKYGTQLPEVHGDWTGYWEDGAGSSALETAENRASSSRLTQAGALWAMTAPDKFPADSFHEAWKNVILYSEHTWGADESVTRPLTQKTMEQWIIKKSYATNADSLSLALTQGALSKQSGTAVANAVDIVNTSSWPRTELVTLSRELSAAGDIVKDAAGTIIPSQRLTTGELAFVAKNIPPFASGRFFISAGKAATTSSFTTGQYMLDNGIIRLTINPQTGAINSLKHAALGNDFADTTSGEGLNDYLYLAGKDTTALQHIKEVTVQLRENGPVLASLQIRSQAPGCTQLLREVTLVKDFGYVDIVNHLDKKPAELNPYPGDYGWANTQGKESLNIAFPFHVPGGEIKVNIPMAMIRPGKDQIPGACKNWLEVGNWADVSNSNMGISWVSLDAPLIEVGGITANLLGGQTNPAVWRKTIEPTQKFYSWALNNHWETNYRAYQLGHIYFRYALQPHAAFDATAVTKFATGKAEPLIATPALGEGLHTSLLQLSNTQLVTLALKPSEDGKAWMVTLYNPGSSAAATTLQWSAPAGSQYFSNTAEQPVKEAGKDITVDAQGVVTLRVEKRSGAVTTR
ncbi:polysaccharide lyase family protein [Deminuibacter soli]|uniref:Glycoside hydrolase n=1 Tax=Deminuibacter soli TaxID=2291815 RepID=A0A3E1NFM4_9BACT|nr:polysaccharide lyase family protein [Deminuibacter soli]RFM26776.1 hypothetical protein DXN05_17430 [Deminuibacter soli]